MYREHSISLTKIISLLVACRSIGASHPPSITTSHSSYSSPHIQSPAPPPPPPPWGPEGPWGPPGDYVISSAPSSVPSPHTLFTSSKNSVTSSLTSSPSSSTTSSQQHRDRKTHYRNDTSPTTSYRSRQTSDETSLNSDPPFSRRQSWI